MGWEGDGWVGGLVGGGTSGYRMRLGLRVRDKVGVRVKG